MQPSLMTLRADHLIAKEVRFVLVVTTAEFASLASGTYSTVRTMSVTMDGGGRQGLARLNTGQ